MPEVNPSILKWARETAGLTTEDAVKKLSINDTKARQATDRLIDLESGATAPTRPMLVKMAKQYRRPLLTFYLSDVPRRGDRGQDFRSLPEGHDPTTDALLDTLLRDVRARQSMVRAVLEDEDEAEALPFIGSVTIADGTQAALSSIRRTIPITLDEYRGQPKTNDAFALLRSRVEQVGIFVLLVGNLGSHHTTIDLETFRGFALADKVAPFIVINDQDAKAAWSFSILHELTHLWLGQTGVSGANGDLDVERFCNDVASEFLVPSAELAQLELPRELSANSVADLISEFAAERHVSQSMVAYKLHRRNVLDRQTWIHLSARFRDEWLANRNDRRRRTREQTGGPSYYVIRRHRVGSALVGLVRRMLDAGALTTTKAGKVLGVKAKNVRSLIDTNTAGAA